MTVRSRLDPQVLDSLAGRLSAEAMQRLRTGLVPRPDGSHALDARGLALQDLQELITQLGTAEVDFSFHVQLSPDDLSASIEAILDWILLHDCPVTIQYCGHAFDVRRASGRLGGRG
jgi:hypothetical protein